MDRCAWWEKSRVACRGAQPPPVLSQGLQQRRAEHNVTIFAALPALDVDDHSPTVNIGDNR
jgi:hypothetical protein